MCQVSVPTQPFFTSFCSPFRWRVRKREKRMVARGASYPAFPHFGSALHVLSSVAIQFRQRLSTAAPCAQNLSSYHVSADAGVDRVEASISNDRCRFGPDPGFSAFRSCSRFAVNLLSSARSLIIAARCIPSAFEIVSPSGLHPLASLLAANMPEAVAPSRLRRIAQHRVTSRLAA